MDKNFLKKIETSLGKNKLIFTNRNNKETKRINFDTPKSNNLDTPDLIKANYIDDINIILIHNTIRDKFGSLLGNLGRMNDHIIILNDKLNDSCNIICKKEINDKINFLKNEIMEIESNSRWNNYVEESGDLLEQYLPLSSNKSLNSIIIETKKKEIFTEEEIEKRLSIIEEYLNIAKKYISLEIKIESSLESKCPICNVVFDEINITHENGTYLCECGYVFDNLDKSSSYRDIDRVNVPSKVYNNKKTFERTYYRWEGTSSDIIPDKLISDLDNYFIKKKFPIGEEIKKLPLLENGKKNKTSIFLMESALNESGNSKFYKIIYPLIYYYWGWKKPEEKIKKLGIRDEIFERYDMTQQVYERNKTRKSCLNVNIRLYQLLETFNYGSSFEDFKTLTTRASLVYNNEQFKIMCDKTCLKFTSII